MTSKFRRFSNRFSLQNDKKTENTSTPPLNIYDEAYFMKKNYSNTSTNSTASTNTNSQNTDYTTFGSESFEKEYLESIVTINDKEPDSLIVQLLLSKAVQEAKNSTFLEPQQLEILSQELEKLKNLLLKNNDKLNVEKKVLEGAKNLASLHENLGTKKVAETQFIKSKAKIEELTSERMEIVSKLRIVEKTISHHHINVLYQGLRLSEDDNLGCFGSKNKQNSNKNMLVNEDNNDSCSDNSIARTNDAFDAISTCSFNTINTTDNTTETNMLKEAKKIILMKEREINDLKIQLETQENEHNKHLKHIQTETKDLKNTKYNDQQSTFSFEKVKKELSLTKEENEKLKREFVSLEEKSRKCSDRKIEEYKNNIIILRENLKIAIDELDDIHEENESLNQFMQKIYSELPSTGEDEGFDDDDYKGFSLEELQKKIMDLVKDNNDLVEDIINTQHISTKTNDEKVESIRLYYERKIKLIMDRNNQKERELTAQLNKCKSEFDLAVKQFENHIQD